MTLYTARTLTDCGRGELFDFSVYAPLSNYERLNSRSSESRSAA